MLSNSTIDRVKTPTNLGCPKGSATQVSSHLTLEDFIKPQAVVTSVCLLEHIKPQAVFLQAFFRISTRYIKPQAVP
ncbi:hypothetical protein M8J76_012349 [Diaphorina citri]|nr:hypothetical protein M8J76_012349 [Diaphorina citri]